MDTTYLVAFVLVVVAIALYVYISGGSKASNRRPPE